MLTRSLKRQLSTGVAKSNGNKTMKPPDIKIKIEKKPLVKRMRSKDVEQETGEEKGMEKNANKTRPDGCEKWVGAHISAAGGLENAPINAAAIGATSFALFLKSQRQWKSKPLEDETAEKFKKECENLGFKPEMILPHGSYLLNCGSPSSDTLEKSRETLIDELQRCEKLGICLYNFHPGSSCGKSSVDECLDRIAECINTAHSRTKYVITVVENMSKQGHSVGGDFQELRGIIDRVQDKARMGICIDTCHAFAAGYDLSTRDGFETMMTEFDNVVGIKYLKALHLNDSKGKLGCHLDRHENIGKGFIGKEAFKWIMHDSRFNNMPMILETPYINDETYKREIKMLYDFASL